MYGQQNIKKYATYFGRTDHTRAFKKLMHFYKPENGLPCRNS